MFGKYRRSDMFELGARLIWRLMFKYNEEPVSVNERQQSAYSHWELHEDWVHSLVRLGGAVVTHAPFPAMIQVRVLAVEASMVWLPFTHGMSFTLFSQYLLVSPWGFCSSVRRAQNWLWFRLCLSHKAEVCLARREHTMWVFLWNSSQTVKEVRNRKAWTLEIGF